MVLTVDGRDVRDDLPEPVVTLLEKLLATWDARGLETVTSLASVGSYWSSSRAMLQRERHGTLLADHERQLPRAGVAGHEPRQPLRPGDVGGQRAGGRDHLRIGFR